jgi:hypothetical protein
VSDEAKTTHPKKNAPAPAPIKTVQGQTPRAIKHVHPTGTPKSTVAKGPRIRSKHDVLLDSLCEFYEHHPDALDVLDRVLRKPKPVVSLRVLDWLVTNYAKKHAVMYTVSRGEGHVSFNLHLEYKSQLKAYSKRYFDPFCRRDRIVFTTQGATGMRTTVGQLNFFKWAVQNGVVDYACRHARDIERDMMDNITKRDELERQKKQQTQQTKYRFIFSFS